MDDASKLFDALAEPRQFVPVDPVMLRVSRLDVGVLELFEPCPVLPICAGPCIIKPAVEPLGLGAEEGEIMIMRRLCRAADYSDAGRFSPDNAPFRRTPRGIVSWDWRAKRACPQR